MLLERKALTTEKKRLSLVGPDDISGKTCMYLKASFIQVVSITSRGVRGQNLLHVAELPGKHGKMVWAAQPRNHT